MKILILVYLALVTSIFGQSTEPPKKEPIKIEEMFYVTIGVAYPMKYHKYYLREERSLISLGIGIRTFLPCDFGIDVSGTFYHNPRMHASEGAIMYLYRPKMLGGFYFGFGGALQKNMDMYLNQSLNFAYKGIVGYQMPAQDNKASFLDVGFDRFQVLTLRSGLLF